MEHLNKVKQDNKLLKKIYRKKVQKPYIHCYSKIILQRMQTQKQIKLVSDNTTQATVQTISASKVAEQKSEYESESDHEQLVQDLFPNTESDNEWIDPS